MKKIITLLCWFVLLFGSFIKCQEQHEVSAFTEKVVYRFYLINRLQGNVSIIFSYYKNKEKQSEYVTSVCRDWDDLSNYRRITEHEFELLLVKKILALAKEIIEANDNIEGLEHQDDKMYESDQSVIADLLKNIDYHVDKLVGKNPSKKVVRVATGLVTTDSITNRFYAIKRLATTHIVFKKACKLNIPFIPSTRSVSITLEELEHKCTHPRITQVIADMLHTKSLEPLAALLDEFQQYRYADDSPFLREMLIMLLTTYRDLLQSNKATMQEQEAITEEIKQILDLYEHVEELSTEEVLDCIDSTTDHLIVIIDKIEERETWYNAIFGWAFGDS